VFVHAGSSEFLWMILTMHSGSFLVVGGCCSIWIVSFGPISFILMFSFCLAIVLHHNWESMSGLDNYMLTIFECANPLLHHPQMILHGTFIGPLDTNHSLVVSFSGCLDLPDVWGFCPWDG